MLIAACEVVTGLGKTCRLHSTRPAVYRVLPTFTHLYVTPVVLQLVDGLLPHILQLLWLLLCGQQWRPNAAAVQLLLLLLLVKAPPKEAGW